MMLIVHSRYFMYLCDLRVRCWASQRSPSYRATEEASPRNWTYYSAAATASDIHGYI